MYENLSPPITFTFNYGVMLAVNAISDAYVIIDGPGCSTYRSYMVHGRHDWNSTMLSATGYHRMQYCGVSAYNMGGDTEAMMREVVKKTGDLEHSGVVLITALPMCTITGPDYERIARENTTPTFTIAERSIDGDWLEGYATALYAVAAGMDLSGGDRKKENVAIVGYFMDRGEGDHLGNLKELRSLCEDLGLKVVAIWPSGGSYKDLAKVRDAGTIISLPHGRRAAKVLAEKLDAELVETAVPFGLGATQEWVRKIALALGKEKEAEALIDRRLQETVPRLEWAIPYAFLDKKLVFMGDPNLLPGLRGMCEDLGLKLSGAYLNGRRPKDVAEGPEALFQPRVTQFREGWERHRAAGEADMLVSNTDGLSIVKPDIPWLEFGFPSIWTHCLGDEPFLGFSGFLHFTGRLARALTAGLQRDSWKTGALAHDPNPTFREAYDPAKHRPEAVTSRAVHDPSVTGATLKPRPGGMA